MGSWVMTNQRTPEQIAKECIYIDGVDPRDDMEFYKTWTPQTSVGLVIDAIKTERSRSEALAGVLRRIIELRWDASQVYELGLAALEKYEQDAKQA